MHGQFLSMLEQTADDTTPMYVCFPVVESVTVKFSTLYVNLFTYLPLCFK
jgi:hypothetical protein